MVYILNTEISTTKPAFIALQKIFGLGQTTVLKIFNLFGISKRATIKRLTIPLKNKLIIYIEKNIIINEDLKQKLVSLKDQQQRLKTYKGLRSRFKLPRRGQRTHTNAKTVKKFYK